MGKIYYIGLAVILVGVVAATFFLTRNLAQKNKKSTVSQPVAQETQPAPKEVTKKPPAKKTQTPVAAKVVQQKPEVATQKIIREKVTVEIPDGVQYTKTCNQNRCVYLIYN